MPDEVSEPAPTMGSPATIIPAPKKAAAAPAQADEANTTLDEDPFERNDSDIAASEPADPIEAPVEQTPDPADVIAAVPVAEQAPAGSLDDMVAGLRGDEGAETDETEAAEGGAVESEAPEAVPPVPAPAEAAAVTIAAADDRALKRRSARVPFYVYVGAWAVFAAVQTYLLWPLATAPFVEQPVYGLLVLVGAGLVCAGPVLGLFVWWRVSAHSERPQRGGLVRAMLMRSAASMAAGVLIWWAALLLLDLRRIGTLG